MLNAANPFNIGAAAVIAVDELYQEDVANVPVVEPAVRADVPKPEKASTQALSSATLHRIHVWGYLDVFSRMRSKGPFQCGGLGVEGVFA